MKKLCLLVWICLFAALALVSCQNGAEQTAHTHTYADDWSFDEDSHWYAATCEHAEEKANVALHTDAQNDGVCDVCAYGSDHEHTFAEDWSSDGESHWHAASCAHDVKGEAGAHVDADNDDLCDVCAYSGDCAHPAQTEAWLTDAQGHWHATSCGHSVKQDAAAHADADNNGACDICAWEDPDHTHTYKTEYAYDHASHWFDADCGHTLKGSQAAHVDANNDGACDTCPWNDGCTHDYSGLWSVDGTNHWHAVVCTHSIAPKDQAAHVDADDDGACDVCGYLDHEHTFDTTIWVFDNSGHWHTATCGCTLKSNEAAHSDADNNGACDVCDWNDGCEHPLQSAYSSNATHHWHEVACAHTVQPTDLSQHKDRDMDGVCDFCAYVTPGHTHTFATTLTVDANSHYYASTCGHSGVRKDEVLHEDMNGDGRCDVCGGTLSLKDVIDRATSTASADKISSGTVKNTSVYHFEGQEPAELVENVTYEFGNGYLHTYDGTYERWFTLLEDGTVFCARLVDGAYELESATIDNMAGYYFVGNFIYYSVEGYGVEALIYNLYYFAQIYAKATVAEHYDAKTDTYSFDFCYFNGYGSLFCVEVTLELNEDAVIERATITSDVYGAFEQHSNGSYYVADGAEAEYEYKLEITQSVGARTAVNEHTPDKFQFQSYDLVDDKGVLYGDTIYLDPDQGIYMYFANVYPATATPKLDDITLTCTGTTSQIYSFVSWSGDSVFVRGYEAGTYTLTLTSANVVKTFTVIVGAPKLLNLMPKVYYRDNSGLFTSKVGKAYTVYAGQTLYFGVMTTPGNAPATFTAITGGGTLGTATIEVGGQMLDVHTFCAQTPGTYTITITSSVNTKVKTTLTVTVSEAPAVGSVLSGTFAADVYDYNVSTEAVTALQVAFAPAAEGAQYGQVTIQRNGTQTEVLNYAYENGKIVMTHASGEAFGYELSLNESYALTISWMYDGVRRTQVLTKLA